MTLQKGVVQERITELWKKKQHLERRIKQLKQVLRGKVRRTTPLLPSTKKVLEEELNHETKELDTVLWEMEQEWKRKQQ